MFQKSLLKNFIKSFNTTDYSEIIRLVTKDRFIAEDANGAEFITLLAQMLNWGNCIREVKNDTDMKKADGVVYDIDNNPIAIIELKSSDKKISNRDIIAQAFRYKNEKPTCNYVIISNFKQLDIYSKSSDTCFSLDMTSAQSYTTLYALLNQASLETNEIARLKKISKSQEEITKEVYKEYSDFRLSLLNNLISNNKELSKEHIFESANKLLDRFMFILFAEDRNLIPANSIDTIIKQYENNSEWGDDTPLYNYYKKYFIFIDEGNSKVKIPKYNGNLFKPDKQLENLIIEDHIIKTDLSHLSAYDFSDDVDVEVLGHIFEQSLNDLEVIKESLFEEHKIVNTRKKDGVFYTPKFITQYIINNTVAKLCEDKKDELSLHVEIKETKRAKEKRRDTLHKYREYIESLKIVDPACGSGAFLTACFRFLLDEHKWIQSELFKYEAGLFDYHDVDKQIIEKNLFGVDINSASVGIAKLSLWLQTAKRDRPLSNLMGNIKSANSLTSDWDELFPEIMANGGFDCVVGNPPYGATFSKEDKNSLKKIYKTIYKGKFDSYHFFIQRGIEILKENGLLGYIIPDSWTSLQQTEKLRKFILDTYIISIQHHSFFIFDDAKIDSLNLILQKKNKSNLNINIEFLEKDLSSTITTISQQRFLENDNLILNYLTSDTDVNVLKKIKKNKTQIKDFCEFSQGLVPYSREGQSEEIVSTRGYHANYKKDETFRKELAGKDIAKYYLQWNSETWISYGKWLHRPRPQKFFTRPRILVQRIRGRMGESIVATYTEEEFYNNPSLSNFISLENSSIDLKFILAVLNSKIINWYFQNTFFDDMNIKPTDLEKLPIPNIEKSLDKYKQNLNYLLTMPKKEKYDKYTKYAIAFTDGQELFTTEFLMAKQLGYIKNFQGHSELREYLKLLPYIFKYYETQYEDTKTNRHIYIIDDNDNRKISHVVDKDGFLVSVYLLRRNEFNRFLKRAELIKLNPNGEAPISPILSPARATFWRHLDSIESLYHNLNKISITQKSFINLVDSIISSKEKIAKYKKHFDSLSAVDKIEIKEETEKLEALVLNSVNEIDSLVYGLYGLSSDEIKIVESLNDT